MALGIGAGDEVITPPFTFVATVGSIARLGARPVFVDIRPDTFNLDPERLRDAITSRTKAVMPVHLFGLSADMDEILQICTPRNLPVIEDAAQSIGAAYKGKAVGSLGTMGCFSFFPSKNLGGAGDGGLVTTNDPKLADLLRVARVHGSRKKYQYELVGMNSRLDALQAAILRVKLRYLDDWTNARQRNAERYGQLFSEMGLDKLVGLSSIPPGRRHVYNQFVIRTGRRDELREHLKREGIPTEIYYPYPLHLEPAFAYLGHHPGDFPITEAACKEVLALPVFPTLTEAQQRRVVTAIAQFFDN
jgi:dTDP-4-amino-4,6-dideoxygalactose transaminase